MEYLLPKSVKRRIEDDFQNHPVISLMTGPLTRMLKGHDFAFSPSEVFYHVFYTWDYIREYPEKGNAYCEYFTDKYTEKLVELCPKASSNDIAYSVCVVMQTLCELFVRTEDSFYVELCPILRNQINQININYALTLHNKFLYAYRRSDLEGFNQFILSYTNTDKEWLSEDFASLIELCAFEDDVEDDTAPKQFSIQQLVLLFSELLDVALSQEGGMKQQHLADLIARVSGLQEKSIRPKISKINSKILKGDDSGIKCDYLTLAREIEEFSPDLARRFRALAD